MKKVLSMLSLTILIALWPAGGFALTINYADLNQGASIYSYSSGINDFQGTADPRDVIGGRDVSPPGYSWYWTGEKGNFIFDMFDMDQYIIVDLGVDRVIDRVGSSFVPYPDDREVWDYFGVSIGTDITALSLVGSIGTKGQYVEVTSSPIYFDLSAPTVVRYVKYEFGQYSPDWDGGSRVYDVYAEATTVPEPATMFLFGAGMAGLAGIRMKRKNP